MDQKVTITDVAREAGVALGTASRVLNNHPSVNKEARHKVLEAAKRLKYVRLRKRRVKKPLERGNTGATGTVGAIIFGLDQCFVDQPVTADAFHGIEQQLALQNKTMHKANVPKLDHVPGFLNDSDLEGLVLRGPFVGELPGPSENEFIHSINGYPAVWLYAKPDGMQGDVVTYDPFQTCKLALRHFQALGHRRVAMINVRPGSAVQECLKTNLFAAAQGVNVDVSLFEHDPRCDWLLPRPGLSGSSDLEPIIAEWKGLPEATRPTGWFVGSDYLAVKVYQALANHGIVVGRELSLISCNYERKLIEGLQPSLTSVNIGAEQMGQRAVDQLIWRTQNPGFLPSMKIMVEPRLMIGDSVRDLN
jgi:LacI family transcriptional regulator